MTTTLDWYGCTTFRLRTAGLTIFLDAYIDRVPDAAGSGRSAADISECDWILVGHSHFDHLFGAEVIAATTGARVVASYETVRVLEALGVPSERMICVAGGETVDLGNGVRATAYPSIHSCVWADDSSAETDQACLGDLGLSHQEQQARFAEMMADLMGSMASAAVEHVMTSLSAHSPRGDGGALLFHIETPDGSVLFQDTSGHWSGVVDLLRPDVAIVAAAGRANIDGEPIQGSLAEFVADHVRRLQPRQVVLGHHDDWLPGFSSPADVGAIRAALGVAAPGAELLELGYVDGTELFDPTVTA